ncbi:outer membrane beta-barrel protein [Flavobacteriaceae bacterium R38]|nr:outer membrane beta-barrel protein [Flavobacteriaceae bacterium R38]
MKKTFLALLLIFTVKSFSQDSKLSLELNYPIPVDNNFLGENYTGVIDFGVKFRFVDLNPVNLGVALNGGILVDNDNLSNEFVNSNITIYTVQPKLFAELDLEALKRFHPTIGLGYSFLIFDGLASISDFGLFELNDTRNGFNFNLGVAYDITDRLFAQVQYDFIRLDVDDDVPDTKFNTNINILKIGIGYRFF